MKIKHYTPIFLLLLFLLLMQSGCKKFLETKSVQTLSTPDNLDDLQLILNNPALSTGLMVINGSTDEYYVNYTNWLSANEDLQRAYIWHPDLSYLNDWRGLYRSAFLANTVLLNLDKIEVKAESERKAKIRGSALFIRAHCFYQLAQEYALQYDPSTANRDLGIVLRLDADFNEASVRATVQQTYDQITGDLEEAVKVLPATTLYKVHPGKAAGYALLARVYLQMGNYSKAKENADASLQYSNTLIDYNSLSATATAPFGDYTKNPEIIFHFTSTAYNANAAVAKVDSTLYSLYDNNDLRKGILFRLNTDKTYAFKGNYTGDNLLFNGIAVDEIYMIRAECNARLGNTKSALQDLNILLIKRWATGKFTPLTASNADDALILVLRERRKELIYRGIRWADIKRLNKEPRFAITLKRMLNGQTYELRPNDLRYAAFIPLPIMNLTNLKQNPR